MDTQQRAFRNSARGERFCLQIEPALNWIVKFVCVNCKGD